MCKIEVMCLARTRIFDFPGKHKVAYVGLYARRQYRFCSVLLCFCLLVPVVWASALAVCMLELGFHFECRKKALSNFFELKMLKLRPLCVYNNCNGGRSIRTSYSAGKSEVWLVTVIVGNAEVYTTVVLSRLRRMERTLYKENCVG